MIVSVLFVGVDLLLVALAIPLLRRRVRPNGLYGLRVPATFADDWVWYEANARFARDLLILGLLHLASTLALSLVPGISEAVSTPSGAWLLLVGVLFIAVIGWRRANHLLANRISASS